MTVTLRATSFEAKVAAVARIKDQIAILKEQEEALLADIEQDLGGFEVRKYPAGRYILDVTRTVKFDAATASRNLSPEKFQEILAVKPDSVLAKKVLSGEDYAACQKAYGFTRKIIPVTDEVATYNLHVDTPDSDFVL